MNNIIKTVLLIAAVTPFSISNIHAQTQPPANDQHKKDTAMLNNRTPRKNTDMPPVKETNKNTQTPANDTQKTNLPAVKDRTPRTFNDQPAIKEVPKNYPPANVHQLKQQRRNQLKRKHPPQQDPDKVKPNKSD